MPQWPLEPWDPWVLAGASQGMQKERKDLNPWWSDNCGLLHLTIPLSLAGLQLDQNLDFYLLLLLSTLLWDELLLRSGPTSTTYMLSCFPA